jgi:hypothetical protein
MSSFAVMIQELAKGIVEAITLGLLAFLSIVLTYIISFGIIFILIIVLIVTAIILKKHKK